MKTRQEQIEAVLKVIQRKMSKKRLMTTTTDIATAIVRAGYGKVSEYKAEIEQLKEEIKQAQIEILGKLKERIETAINTYFNLDGGGYYLAEDVINDIDELITEIENNNIR